VLEEVLVSPGRLEVSETQLMAWWDLESLRCL